MIHFLVYDKFFYSFYVFFIVFHKKLYYFRNINI